MQWHKYLLKEMDRCLMFYKKQEQLYVATRIVDTTFEEH